MGYADLTKKKDINTVLGIDASTNSVAFCVYNKTGPVQWGEIHFNGATAFERLADGQKKIHAIKDQLSTDMIVIESAIYVQNKKTVILLAYAFGAILSAIINKGTKVEELSPIQWQSAIGNKNLTKIEKENIRNHFPNKSESWYSAKNREFRKLRTTKWVSDTYGINVASDNVSDAIAIAHVGFSKFVV